MAAYVRGVGAGMLASRLLHTCEMAPAAKPICPLCGCAVPEGTCNFLYPSNEEPNDQAVPAKVMRYECDCGYKFSVVAFESECSPEEKTKAVSQVHRN